MIPERLSPPGARRGYVGIIVLLVVVVVVMLLLLSGPLSTNPQTQTTQAQAELGKARGAACSINRHAVEANLINWQIMHSGEKATPQILENLVYGHGCPDGGIFYLGKDGHIYCTKHDPPPASEMKDLIEMVQPTPSPTPASSNTLPPDLLTPTPTPTPTPTATPTPATH